MIKKPDLEYFYNRLYKGFCGNCGRILFTGDESIDKLSKKLTVCKWCNCQIDWEI